MARHHDLGKAGEQKAASYLLQQGYSILERNWRLGHLELDLICKQGDTIVVVEVKTRHSKEEYPEELLSYAKRRCLRRAADAYLRARNCSLEVRFDLIVMTGEAMEIEHFMDAIQIFE